MEIKPFKARASALAKIMTTPKSKKESLSVGAKTYCQDWLKEQLYGQRNEIWSKYMAKGTECEDKAISLLSIVDNQDYTKNICTFESEYITGTPDIIHDAVHDVKCSWDFSTMPLFDSKIENKDYVWQLQAYMILCNKSQARLRYCLVNTPEYLDSRKISYDETPLHLRVKSFDLERDESLFDLIAEKVEACRKYIDELLNEVSE